MPDVSVERRSARRHAMILAAEVVELPSGTKLSARTADIGRTGCYVDMLNPIPPGSQVQLRLTRHEETFVTLARVIYVSPGLGMGLAFIRVEEATGDLGPLVFRTRPRILNKLNSQYVVGGSCVTISAPGMNLPLFRFSLLLSMSLFLAGEARPSQGQEVESGYGPLPVFEFHSGFWVNLHQFLYHEARLRESTPEAKAAADSTSGPALKQNPVTLTAAEQKTWEQAIAYYRANYAGKDPQINIDLILLKNQLGDFEDCDELLGRKKRACDAGLPGNIGVILEAAAPVYRAHWWANQDRANRRWVARVAPLIREQGVGLSQRLADIYQSTWPRAKIRVEVCAFASSSGAFTTLDPLRVTISSTEPRNQAPDSLEVLFHEASHGIAIPVEDAITRECRQRDKPIPRDLWHALIFYTTSEVLRPVLQEAGPDPPSGDAILPRQATSVSRVPPDLREKFTQRGWEEYIRLLNVYWQPYLDGKVNFEDAIAHLVSAV